MCSKIIARIQDTSQESDNKFKYATFCQLVKNTNHYNERTRESFKLIRTKVIRVATSHKTVSYSGVSQKDTVSFFRVTELGLGGIYINTLRNVGFRIWLLEQVEVTLYMCTHQPNFRQRPQRLCSTHSAENMIKHLEMRKVQ